MRPMRYERKTTGAMNKVTGENFQLCLNKGIIQRCRDIRRVKIHLLKDIITKYVYVEIKNIYGVNICFVIF